MNDAFEHLVRATFPGPTLRSTGHETQWAHCQRVCDLAAANEKSLAARQRRQIPGSVDVG